jgi:predicted nuclease of predicted toxin-antitoxin system
MSLAFLADECVDQQIVERLRQDGHHVAYVPEMVPGISDDAVLQGANEKQALLLTADKDFGELIFRQGKMAAGVVLIRLAGLSPTTKAEIVAQAILEHGGALFGSFCVIAPGSLRIRSESI